MKKLITILLTLFVLMVSDSFAKNNSYQTTENNHDTLPVRGFEIVVPRPSGVDSFVTFIKKELIPRHVNTLVLRVDYSYQFKSHPELIDSFALSEKDVKKIVRACKQGDIKIIPQINLLGHQSWANRHLHH
jgi:hypothetical protein